MLMWSSMRAVAEYDCCNSLQDLVKCTPTSHADYDTLMKTLQVAQNFLEKFESKDSKDNVRIS